MLLAPARKTWVSAAVTGVTEFTVNVPAGASVGDLLLISVGSTDPAATVITPPGSCRTVLPRTTFGSQIAYIFAATITSASQTFLFTLNVAASLQVSTSVIGTTTVPLAITTGAVWKRPSSGVDGKAPSVTVAQAGSLVLAYMFESSNANEKETDVSTVGLPRWFFARQSTTSHTTSVQYVDHAPAGLTSEANQTYLNASSNFVGVQLIIPPSEGGDTPPPTAPYATITQQTYNSLRVGALVTDAPTVTALATPVGGGTSVPVGSVTPSPHGWVNIKATGLDAGVEYDVALISLGIVLTTVRGQTLSPARESFTALTGSCQGNGTNPVVFAQMAAEHATFLFHQGDLHYRDTQDEATWRAGVDMALSASQMRNFIRTTPMFWRWDNHDWGGSLTWRDSPVSAFAPAAFRELFGSDFVHPKALYQSFSHRGVRFVDTDQWTLRDEALTTPSTDSLPGKSMWSKEQREWFFQTLLDSNEPLIIWFTSFPLYSNLIGNGRWGNYLDEVSIIQSFFDDHPEIRARIVAVGGDSHNVCADDGTNGMWGIPSLNASPFSQSGGLASGTWNITNIDVPDDRGYYSRLEFNWDDADELAFTWTAVRDDGATTATWSKSFPREWYTPFPIAADAHMWDGSIEVPAYVSVWDGTDETPATIPGVA